MSDQLLAKRARIGYDTYIPDQEMLYLFFQIYLILPEFSQLNLTGNFLYACDPYVEG